MKWKIECDGKVDKIRAYFNFRMDMMSISVKILVFMSTVFGIYFFWLGQLSVFLLWWPTVVFWWTYHDYSASTIHKVCHASCDLLYRSSEGTEGLWETLNLPHYHSVKVQVEHFQEINPGNWMLHVLSNKKKSSKIKCAQLFACGCLVLFKLRYRYYKIID